MKAVPMNRIVATTLAAFPLFASPAASAELELSLYLGVQSVQDSSVSGTLPGVGLVNRSIDWKGKPFDAPIYYGARAMWWLDNDLGFGIEGTHTKAYMSDADLNALGLSRFELSDGHNIFTANVMKRWPGAFSGKENFTPYVGGGLGVAIPHVDAQEVGGSVRTYDYEYTGLALRGIAGMKYAINEDWAVFGEYQFTWSDNSITVDPSPGQAAAGKLSTDLTTHAVNVGVSYSF